MKFKDVIGQQAVKKQLIGAVKAGHVGHALMFLGPEGSGNLALAIAFAGYIFCENPGEFDRCGYCASCKKMDVLGHPDLHFSFPIVLERPSDNCEPWVRTFVDTVKDDPYLTLNKWEKDIIGKKKKALINVHEANRIIKTLSLKSFNGGHKVSIIWMAEELNRDSANKLLKTFEEPTEKTIVILVVNSTEEMLPTVISRTQLVKCNRLSQEDISAALQASSPLSYELAHLASWQADGDLAKARRIVGKEDDGNKFLDIFTAWMRACVKSNISGAMAVAEALAGVNKEEQQHFLEYCLQFLHESIVYVHVGPEKARFDEKARSFAERFAPFMAQCGFAGFHDIFSTAHYHVERNANPTLLFMHTSHEMMKLFAQPKPELIS